MPDIEPTPGQMRLAYATPAPVRTRRRIVLLTAIVLIIALVSSVAVYLQRRGYTIQIAPPTPATAPAAAATASPAALGLYTPPPPPTPKLKLPKDRPRVKVYQRSLDAIPGSDGTVYLELSDISGGQVTLSVSTSSGASPLASGAVHEGETLEFSLDGNRYIVVLVELHNRLVGTDWGVLAVRAADDPPTEEEKIGQLITAAAKTNGTVIVALQNTTQLATAPAGETSSANDFLRTHWAVHRRAIRTASDFVQQIPKPPAADAPTLRMPDRSEQPLHSWLAKEHEKLK